MTKRKDRALLGVAAAGLAIAAQGVPAAAQVGSARAAASDCGGWHTAWAAYNKYATSKSDCAYESSSAKKDQRKGYKWSVQAGSNSWICVQAQGHTWSTKKHKTISKWYSAGCGTSGTVTVPWHAQPRKGGGYQGIIAYPKVKAMIMPGTLGGLYMWRG